MSDVRSPKTDAAPVPTDAELSRIAREAVHQPADPRLDRQLARLGVMAAGEPAQPRPAQPTVHLAEASTADLDRVKAGLRRLEMIVAAVVVVVMVLSVIAVILLLR